MTPASTRTRDRWTEARRGPGPVYTRNGKRPHTIQRTCDDTASWPAALRERVTGHQEGSRGLIIPSRRMYSTAPVRGLSCWCPRVSLKSTSAHQCPACACGQKTTLSSRGTAPNRKSRPAAQRLAATEEWRPGRRRATSTQPPSPRTLFSCDVFDLRLVGCHNGQVTTRRGAGDPERRAEWTTVSRYGHLQSALGVVDACYARSGNRLHSVHPCVVYTRHRRLLDGFLPLRRCTNASLRSDAFSVQKDHVECGEIHFTSSSLLLWAVGVNAPPFTPSGCPKWRGS